MPWTMDVLTNAGGALLSDQKFRSARLSWGADAVGTAEIDLISADVIAASLRAGQKRIAFRDGGGTRRFQGWLDRVGRTGPPGDLRFKASCRGLSVIFEQRVVHGDFTRVATVSTTIAWDLIQHTMAQTDGALGFTLGTVTGTAPARDMFLCDGDIISDRLAQLAERAAGGFAWEIDADGAFNAWVGGRGVDVSGSVTLSPSSAIDWACDEDTSELATYATALGDAEAPCGPPLAIDSVSAGLRSTYGRKEVVLEDLVEENLTDLNEQIDEELEARLASRIMLSTSWVEGRGPWSFGTRWIGDIVTAELGSEYGGNTTVKLAEIDIFLDPGRVGTEPAEFVTYRWVKA